MGDKNHYLNVLVDVDAADHWFCSCCSLVLMLMNLLRLLLMLMVLILTGAVADASQTSVWEALESQNPA